MSPAELERFMEKVSPEPTSGCWLWTGAAISAGYGYARVGDKNARAHKAAYEHFKGPVPDGMCVCHSCDVRCCVNPDHLWLGTHKDNAADKMRKGRFNRVGSSVGWRNVGHHGRSAYNAKLTDEQVREARALWASRPRIQRRNGIVHPLSLRGLANRFGVSTTTLANAISGKGWRHVA